MSNNERRDNNQTDTGRRKLADRRRADSSTFNGIDQRSGNERRTLLDRRR